MASSRHNRDLVGGDRSLWIVIVLLSIFSILVVYSSTASMAYRNMDGDTSHYLIRQVRFVMAALSIIYITHLINFQFYFKKAKWIFRIAVFLMLLTFFSGSTFNEATRWLTVPYTSLTFQPADILKIAIIIKMASFLAAKQKVIHSIPILPSFNYFNWNKYPDKNFHILHRTTIPLLGPIALVCLMVMVSNLSTAIIIGLTSIIVLIIGRVRWWEIVRLLMAIFIVFALAVSLLKAFNVGRVDTWISRIENFMASEADYGSSKDYNEEQFQVHQAKISVASGWIMGRGPGNSTQRSNLPHPYSDYAYAFIVEEYGLLGAVLILGCYLWIFYRSILIFRKCDTAFPSFLVLGLSLVVTIQALLHMGVSVDAAPVTGQTLPIISLGGSSLIFTCISLGIILSVSRQQNAVEYQRLIEEKRHLVVDEWEHVVITDETEEEVAQTKKSKRKNREADDPNRHLKEISYQGIMWDEDETEDKDNS